MHDLGHPVGDAGDVAQPEADERQGPVERRRLRAPRGALAALATSLGSCEAAEASAIDGTVGDMLREVKDWQQFAAMIIEHLGRDHHVVARGLPNDPAAFVLAASAAGTEFRTYRSNKVVKFFKMSPWTRALSHTIAEGHFHTD
ncbi:MAG: hypothetical protein KY453_11620, partial [Gemmatimonadetes bacterium]|nr:hypothetical protein [Gemmatimonadota bacterium]